VLIKKTLQQVLLMFHNQGQQKLARTAKQTSQHLLPINLITIKVYLKLNTKTLPQQTINHSKQNEIMPQLKVNKEVVTCNKRIYSKTVR
jgi:hypothetical protein